MATLEQLAKRDRPWSLTELVDCANGLLPQYLPTEKAHTRVRETVTPRLVRHYTHLGLLDSPQKQEGRYATYRYRHLLQLLLIRRLLAEGFGASAIDQLAVQQDNAGLEALLAGGLKLAIAPAHPTPPQSATTWTRLEVLSGLEIHIRQDFPTPQTWQEQ